MRFIIAVLVLLSIINSAFPFAISSSADFRHGNPSALVNLRIEGSATTIFENYIVTTGHNVTTPSGGNHICDGTNLNANPSSGPTVTTSLADAAAIAGFTWDGTWYPSFQDFFISRIATDTGSSAEYWALLVDYTFTPVGGCQQRVKNGDEVLIAFIPVAGQTSFLKLEGSRSSVRVGRSVTFTVTDGATGTPVAGALVGDGATDTDGKVIIRFMESGVKVFKATREGSVRSNAVGIEVY